MSRENTARSNHRNGMSCSAAVYAAFDDINASRTVAPSPRSEGGKCGAVLAAEKVLKDLGIDGQDEFESVFREKFGSLKCFELLGKRRGQCNEFVGAATALAEEIIEKKSRK